jgi:hypothetical protein
MLSSIEEERPQRGSVRLVARGPSEGEQTKDRCGENVPGEPLTRISLAVRGGGGRILARFAKRLDPRAGVEYVETPHELTGGKPVMRRFNLRKCTGILVLTLFFGSAAVAQQEEEASLRQQIEELKKGQDEIRKELADIKKLLQASAARAAAPAAPDVRNLVLDVGSNPFRGEVTAKLTLVEFTDYQ